MSTPKPEDTGGTPPLNTTESETDAPEVGGAPNAGEPLNAGAKAYVDPDVVNEIRVAELEGELEKVKDQHLRALAEAENIRRRAQRDREDGARFAAIPLARDLLPVYDNLQRALKSLSAEQRANAADLVAGLELTEREFLSAFNKRNIVAIEPELGDKFDVKQHQAMYEAPVPGTQSGTIIEVVSTGFVCHDRLVRAAMVGVSKGAPAAEAPTSASASASASGTGGAASASAASASSSSTDGSP